MQVEEPSSPSKDDLEFAVERLLRPDALCFADLELNNDNSVAAELSFNSVIIDRPSGRLEVALRGAIVDLTSEHYSRRWRWSKSFLDLTDGLTYSAPREETTSELASLNRTDQNDVKPDLRGKIKTPVFDLEAGLGAATSHKTDAKRDSSRSSKQTFSEVRRQIEVSRIDSGFRMTFAAPSHLDLVDLNSKLSRLMLVDVPAETEFSIANVRLTLMLRSVEVDEAGTKHAFRIRQATGVWSELDDAAGTKRLVSEVMLSKLLVPIHQTQTLWPEASFDHDR
jgi:hypothetical protein